MYECSRLSRSIENSSLYGVVSSFPPGSRDILRGAGCEISLKDLPSGATVRFEALYSPDIYRRARWHEYRSARRNEYRSARVIGQTTEIVRETGNPAANMVYVNVPDNGTITISYVPGGRSSFEPFRLQYSGRPTFINML